MSRRDSGVFDADVHQGVTRSSRASINIKTGELERSEDYAYLKKTDVDIIKNVLSYHENILTSDYVVPGTLYM